MCTLLTAMAAMPHNFKIMRIAVFFSLLSACLLGQSAKDFADAFSEGRRMDLEESRKREQSVTKHPSEMLDRTRLIAFYTFSDKVPEAEAIAARRRHLLWFAQEKPDSWLWGQRSYATAVYVSGPRLADPDGFRAIRDAWLTHLAAKNLSPAVRDNAASFLQVGDRETATRLIRGMQNPRYLGTNFALILLGVTSRDFDNGEPLAADPSERQTPFAQAVVAELERSSDPQLVGGAGFWLSRDGAILWNRGYMAWDYSPLAKELLAKARALEPTRLDWFFSNPELPKPGEVRGIGQVRVGGAVIAQNAVKIVKPDVPPELKSLKGSVGLNIAIGFDGRVLKAIPTSGPAPLYDLSVMAVEQWVYKPTSVGGKPVIVLSSVELDFN
jgi:hypothetical protein